MVILLPVCSSTPWWHWGIIPTKHIDVTTLAVVYKSMIYDQFALYFYLIMTSLEHLPDELWLEIFSYISDVHLFPSFVGLNARIDTFLPMNIRLQCKTALSYERSQIFIEAFPNYITNLSVDYYDQDIDLSPLRNLVSLRLGHATDQQLTLIRSNHFKHLNQLTIIVCSISYPLGDILFGENQLHGLTTCRLPTLDLYFHRYKSYRSCLTLQSLHLNYCHTNTFHQALQFLPNLVRFESSIVPLPLHQFLTWRIHESGCSAVGFFESTCSEDIVASKALCCNSQQDEINCKRTKIISRQWFVVSMTSSNI